jgi:hypothetical protein
MALMVFQKPGSASPFDTADVCANMISSADPSGRPGCNGGVSTRLVGMQPGVVLVVVTNEDGTPGEYGDYQLTVTSDTSTCL